MSHQTKFSTIIFTKNRACQLDSLLRSMCDHIAGNFQVDVLWYATDQSFQAGYDIVRKRAIVPDITWFAQANFRNDLLKILQQKPSEMPILFLVDDDIFYQQFESDAVLKVFLKKHLFIDLCFFKNDGLNSKLPDLVENEYCEWRWAYWRKKGRPRMYPFCLDGHIYRQDVLLKLISNIDFQGPNSLEARMNRKKRSGYIWNRRAALAPLQPVLFNNPLNSVQIEGETAHQDLSAAEINARFCDGYEIDNGLLYAVSPNTAHFPVPISFVKRVV